MTLTFIWQHHKQQQLQTTHLVGDSLRWKYATNHLLQESFLCLVTKQPHAWFTFTLFLQHFVCSFLCWVNQGFYMHVHYAVFCRCCPNQELQKKLFPVPNLWIQVTELVEHFLPLVNSSPFTLLGILSSYFLEWHPSFELHLATKVNSVDMLKC